MHTLIMAVSKNCLSPTRQLKVDNYILNHAVPTYGVSKPVTTRTWPMPPERSSGDKITSFLITSVCIALPVIPRTGPGQSF